VKEVRLAGRRSPVALAVVMLALVAAGCDPASVYGPLKGQWSVQTPGGAPIAAKPAADATTVYIGSWDGKEYAFGQASGALSWSTYLGVTRANCGGSTYTQGVTSSPWLQGGFAYLGGGGSTWDALDSAAGTISWTVPTGDNSVTGGHYNWSSPIVYNGYAYVGIASFCDEPLVQGELLQVNLSTHQITNVFKVVPDGQVGGTIWTNPVVDPATNTIYVATGNRGGPNQPHAQSIVALDATTLAVKDSWSLPANDPTIDADFATSPVLFTDSGGRRLVAVTNKNGMLYALQRDNLRAGPVWQTQIAVSVNVCDMACGSFSTGVFDGTQLYYAAGQTTIAGKTAGGSIRAIDPATGAFLWQHALPAQVYGAIAAANGMVAVPSSDGGLYVVSRTDGSVLYANALTGAAGAEGIFGAPTIAGARLFIGTTDGVVHAFNFPTSPGGAATVLARASRSPGGTYRQGSASCHAARGALLTADCRIATSRRTLCSRLGQLPAAVGSVVVDHLTMRASGRGARMPATVHLYTNGSCSGRPVKRMGLIDGYGSLRSVRPWKLSPDAVVSLRATRALNLSVRMVGRSIRAAAPPWGTPLPPR
jgi:polyvinyl alcohol dehydrogenase (cytochrome)